MQRFEEDKDIISFFSLFSIFLRWKLLIILVVALTSLSTVYYAVNQVNIYRAKIIAITPSKSGGGGLSGISNQLGGLAGLAGINLGSSDKTLDQIKDLVRSRSFLQGFIERHNLVADIIAANGWDKKNNILLYNSELYDEKNKVWVRSPPPGKLVIPSSWEAYPILQANIKIEALIKKSMLKISVDHYSPHIAKLWVELLLADLNELYKNRSKKETMDSIIYLEKTLEKARLTEVRTMLSNLLEEQIKSKMLSEVRQEFVLETLSPAVFPEDKDSPKRALIVIVGTILGSILALLLALILNFFFPKKNKEG